MIDLYSHQKQVIEKLRSGSILLGGTGSGKSITALAYVIRKELKGDFNSEESEYKPPELKKKIYIITTAKKRDDLEWEEECAKFALFKGDDFVVDSWNNIKKYKDVKNSVFIFDEQRVVGYGAWAKSFIKIAKSNKWILLTATPGDTWSDYIPVFIANGFYKNKTEFIREHVVYNQYTKFPKIEKYIGVKKLILNRDRVLINMHYVRKTIRHEKRKFVEYDKDLFNKVVNERWNIFKNEPIKEVSQFCHTLRRVVNSHPSRVEKVKEILKERPKVIIFYNFNYELEALLKLGDDIGVKTAQLNGHKHEDIPKTKSWIYLVQYSAGAEAWNCIETDTIIFYSQNHSYKITEQAKGRIDRVNTPFEHLYYFTIVSKSWVDFGITECLKNKKDFNESAFFKKRGLA